MSKRLIYAEDAIKELSDALAIIVKDNEKSAKFIIDKVPSAQPEIIRCDDCIHNGSFDTDCPIGWNGKEYCSFAEREEEEDNVR